MRRAGVLLHPTALPGRWGMGDFGPACREWIDRLAATGTRIWQVLPMQPPSESGEPGCPYLTSSAFAIEESLASLDDLLRDGLLRADEIPPYRGPASPVDFLAVAAHRVPLVRLAASRLDPAAVEAWRAENPWVDAWAVYRVCQRDCGPDWRTWPERLRDDPARAAEVADPRAVALEVAVQHLLARQWAEVDAHAGARGVEIWGDIPIFVDTRSCDVWGQRELWKLGRDLEPLVVSGVPPDLFSEDGQKWGHPIYDVAAHQATGHRWWVERVRAALRRADVVRFDHFRGFAACWEVPTHDPDAKNGTWVPGLGAPLLQALVDAFGSPLPLFAEDLGVITPDVEALRDRFGLAGMAVLQFGADGDEANNVHHPARHVAHQVVYSGTHDTDTAVGWASSLDEASAERACASLGADREGLADALIDATLGSVADTAIVLAQDLVGLGSEARVNRPGTWGGNWAFRLPGWPSDEAWARWSARLEASGRRQTVP